jgi:hypothetical protein
MQAPQGFCTLGMATSFHSQARTQHLQHCLAGLLTGVQKHQYSCLVLAQILLHCIRACAARIPQMRLLHNILDLAEPIIFDAGSLGGLNLAVDRGDSISANCDPKMPGA